MSGRIVTHRSRGNYNPNYNKQDYIISNRDNIITNSDTKDTLLSLSGCLFRGGQVAALVLVLDVGRDLTITWPYHLYT